MKIVISFLLVMFLIPAVYSQAKRKSVVLLITGLGNKAPDHIYHSWKHPYYNEIITGALKDVADVTVTEDLSVLTDKNLEKYDLIINNSLFKVPTVDQQAAFYKFIESGKSYLALHAGLVGFGDHVRYNALIGASFTGHVDIKTFVCNMNDNWYGWEHTNREKHVIAAGIEDFKILDELYYMQFITPDVNVIARAEYHPIVWWKNYGKGKVVGFTLGHGDFSMQNDNYKTLLTNSVLWLGGNLK